MGESQCSTARVRNFEVLSADLQNVSRFSSERKVFNGTRKRQVRITAAISSTRPLETLQWASLMPYSRSRCEWRTVLHPLPLRFSVIETIATFLLLLLLDARGYRPHLDNVNQDDQPRFTSIHYLKFRTSKTFPVITEFKNKTHRSCARAEQQPIIHLRPSFFFENANWQFHGTITFYRTRPYQASHTFNT